MTNIYFQANVWVFTALVFIIGIMMGIGKAAVYKHIPEYFPRDIGVVGGIVGVLGGLGGFILTPQLKKFSKIVQNIVAGDQNIGTIILEATR